MKAISDKCKNAYPKYFMLFVGVGKSTLGNYFLGYDGYNGPFKVYSSFGRVTTEPDVRVIEINDRGRKLNLIDTPGLFDLKDNLTSEFALKKLANTINHCSYGIQAIVLVLKKEYNSDTINKRIKIIEGHFGKESLNYMLVAFTHFSINEMDKNSMRNTFNSDIENFLKNIGDRWIVSPNPDLFVHESVAENIISTAYENINEAKVIIDSFSSAYTTKMFNHAQEVLKAGGCFSLDTIVTLENGKKIEMGKVKIGDKVACGIFNGDGIVKLEYSEVYLIAHLDKHQRTEFLTVEYTKPDGMTGNYINSTFCV